MLLKRDAVIFVVQLFAGAIIARSLGVYSMGIWIILLMIPSYAEPLGRLKTDVASVHILGKGRYRLGEVSFTSMVICLITVGLLIGAFLWQQERLYASFLAEVSSMNQLVYLMLIFVPIKFLVLNFQYLLLSQEDLKGYNNISFLIELAPMVLGGGLVLATDWGVSSLVVSTLLGGSAALAYGIIRVQKIAPMVPTLDISLIKEITIFGSKLYLLSIVGYLHVYLSGLVVVLYLATEDVAFFRLGQEKALLLAKLPAAVGTFLFVRVAANADNPVATRDLTVRSFRLTLLLMLLAGVLGAAIAKPAVLLIYGSEFSGIVLALLIIVPAVIANGSTSLITQFFTGTGRIWTITFMSVASLCIQLPLLWFAVPRWGVAGAAGAVLAAYVFTAVMRVTVFSIMESVSLRQLLIPNRSDVTLIREFVEEKYQAVLRLLSGQSSSTVNR